MAKTVMSGGDKLRQVLSEMSKKVQRGGAIEVGVFEVAQNPDKTSVARVAKWIEFGNSRAPPRPFMRQTINEHQDSWSDALGVALKNTDYDTGHAMEQVGNLIASQMQETIASGKFKPDSEHTNLLKNRYPKGIYGAAEHRRALSDLQAGAVAPADRPLVWSETLRSSIKSKVMDHD